MSKYIDADKLKTWLENEADMEFKKTEENANSPVLCHFHNGCRMQALDTIDFITSLQQEHPELPGYDKALLEVKSKVDKLYEEASIGLNEYDSGLYNGIAETCMKLRGFIKARTSKEHPYFDKVREIKTGRVFLAEYSSEAAEWYEAGTGKAYSISDVEIVKQEQQEVNFEDFDKEFAKFSNDPDAMDYAFPIDLADYKDFARHFYELGLNARKEE